MKVVILLSLTLMVLSDSVSFNPFPIQDQFFQNIQKLQSQNNGDGMHIIRFTFNPSNLPVQNPIPIPHFCCGPPIPPPFTMPPFPQLPLPFFQNQILQNEFRPIQLDETPQEGAIQSEATTIPQDFGSYEPPTFYFTQVPEFDFQSAEEQKTETQPEQPAFEYPTSEESAEKPVEPIHQEHKLIEPPKVSQVPVKVQENATVVSQQKDEVSPAVKTIQEDDDDDDQLLPSWAVFLIFVSFFASVVIISKLVKKVKERRRLQAQPQYPISNVSISQQIQYHYAEAKRLEAIAQQEQQRLQYENTQGPIGYDTSRNQYPLPRPDPVYNGYGRVV